MENLDQQVSDDIAMAMTSAGTPKTVDTHLSTLMNTHLKNFEEISSEFYANLTDYVFSRKHPAENYDYNQLFSIANAIAAAKNKAELQDVIVSRVLSAFKLFGFRIEWKNRESAVFETIMRGFQDNGKEQGGFERPLADASPVSKGLIADTFVSGDFALFTINELQERYKDTDYLDFLRSSGVSKIIGISLRPAQQELGCSYFYLSQPAIDHFSRDLLIGLANQISVAIANLLAREEIQMRQAERELLLSLNVAIATVRDNNDLLQVINLKLKDLLGFSHTLIATINEDRESASAFLLDPEAKVQAHPNYKEAKSLQYPINDGVMNQAFSTPLPVLFDLTSDPLNGDWPVYARMNFESGLKQLAIIRFAKEEFVFGFWMLYFEHEGQIDGAKLQLIQSLANQISIAVANISANNEINSYKQRLEEETVYLKEEIETSKNYGDIIGEGVAMQKIFRMVSQVAPTDSTVLILGETGTGKELIARAIHNNSPRKSKLMVKVNCAALPANLIESELFGHERGSFTGATERRLGKFELADGGTLFLDEIGEMPVELQVKLLRALQEREIERVGGRSTIKVDVRIIAATNRDLEKEMEEGRFRSDLYYRLNIFPISLCPLRERKEDIPLLATHFIHRYSKKIGRNINTLSNKVLQEMMQYQWPGNIREMEHLIERSLLLTTGDTLKQIYLPTGKIPLLPAATATHEFSLKTIDENERDHILNILKYCNGRISGSGGAADILGVPASTLNSKIKRLGIKRAHLV